MFTCVCPVVYIYLYIRVVVRIAACVRVCLDICMKERKREGEIDSIEKV